MNQIKPAILVITELFPEEELFFLGSFVFNQLKELTKLYRIAVIVPVSFKSKVKQGFAKRGDLDVYYVKDYFLAFLSAMFKLGLYDLETLIALKKKFSRRKIIGLAKKLDKKYKFQLGHGHEAYTGDEATGAGRSLGIPSIITIHNLYDYHNQLFGQAAMKAVIKNLNNADRIVTVSKIAADSYIANGVKKSFQIIPEGIGDICAGSSPEPLRGYLKDKTVILSVGLFLEAGRIDQAIYAAAKLKEKYKNFVLLIIGTGPLESLYEQIAANNGLKDRILVLGQIPPSEMMSYFAAADFILHPSVVDGFSMVCLEAMAAGKPFICTKNIGITEYITDGIEAFVVPPDDIAALTEKMDLLLKNPGMRKTMGQAAYRASTKFRWDNLIPKISALYSDSLKGLKT